MSRFLELTKPRITLYILMSTAIGFMCGAHLRPTWTWMQLFHALLGTALIASGTAALNQWYEHEFDAMMARTKARPIPSGRVTAGAALAFGVCLSVAGFAELWLGVNLLTALLGLFTLASYLFVYTPLKRVSPVSTTIGAIPGAMPPLIGYAAACGRLNFEAGILYAILFLWQFPHFYAIAWMYREDYARAGIRMLPVVEPNMRFHGSPHYLVFAGSGADQPGAQVLFDGRKCVPARSLRTRDHDAVCRIPGGFGPHSYAGTPGIIGEHHLPSFVVWLACPGRNASLVSVS